MNDILKHRQAVNANIQRLFGEGIDCNSEFQKAQDAEIEKARHGTYADTAQNRKLNRVGQEYGHKAQEQEPSGKQPKGSGEDAGGKDYSSHAQGASDEALRRAAADEKADKEVRDAAKKELGKRGKSGGGDDGNGVVDVAKDKLFSGKFSGDSLEYNDILESLYGKTFNDSKYGECDAKEYVRLLYEFRNASDSQVKRLKSGMNKNTPHGAAYYKASEDILNNRKSGDKMFEQTSKDKEKKKRLGKSANLNSKTLENSLGLEYGEPKSKEARNAMGAVRYAVKNFLSQNPSINVTEDEWNEIAEGYEDGTAYQKYSKLEGFEELNDCIEEYVDVAASED